MTLRDELELDLSKAGLSHIAKELANLSRDCVRMRSTPSSNEAIPVGSSHLGGLPDLPPNTSWPQWKTGYLTFVAQVNLGELPANDSLPTTGLLSLFYDRDQRAWGFDPDHREGFRLWYFPEPAQLARTPEPKRSPFSCARLTFEPILSLPDTSHESFKNLLLDVESEELYYDFIDIYRGQEPHHQILGMPHVIQNEMEIECQLVTNGLYTGDASGYNDPRRKELERGSCDWTLLLQIDSDDNAKMMWGDAGILYVWIRHQDLASRNFEKVWTILQCF